MTTRTWTALATGAAMIMATGCGMGGKQTPPPPPVAASLVAEKPGKVVEEEVVSVAAKVVKIDQKTRVVALLDSDGRVFEVKVGDDVKNLPQVKRGDDVVATYYQSLALTLRKPGEAKPGLETADVVDTAAPGEKPAGGVATKTTLTATVVGLNKKKGTITLKGPKGKTVTLTARDPKRLEPVKVGDLIEAEYTEAIAISVEKPEQR
jgi:hypothetical protein